MKLKHLLLALTGLLSVAAASAQDKVAIKTNILYGAAALAPNLGVEVGLKERSSVSLWGGVNSWNNKGSFDSNKKLSHWIVMPEYRYWFCERFNGHAIGAHALVGHYNISERKIPLLFESGSEKFRFRGNIYGVGVGYSYNLPLTNRLNLELALGVGYAMMKYDKYECVYCGLPIEKGVTRNYFGPTKAGISLVWMLK